MAERSVVLKLRADIGDLKAKLGEVEKAIAGVSAQQAQQAEASTFASGAMSAATMEEAEAYDVIGGALVAMGGAATAAYALAVNASMQYQAALSGVQAATGETSDNMDELSEAALRAGADTQFSATQAADAITALAKAGVSTSDILGGGLTGALDLAAAGELDVAQAAEIAATAMTQFELSGNDVTHIADLLAAGAGKAQGEVTDLGMALSQAGLVASQTGLSIEETTAGLSAFAASGLLGSDAGTSFRSMLQRLTPQSAEAQAEMDRLGISAYDAQGQFIGLSEFAGNLRQSMQDMTPEARNAAMAVIFGSDAVRAANVLYEQGAQGISRWEQAVDDSGFAAEQAAAKTDNLKGDLERLSGAWETALIRTGEGADGPIRGAVQRLDALVTAYANAGEGAQTAARWILGVVGVVGLVGGTAMLTVPKIVAFEAALAGMGAAGARASAMLVAARSALIGPWGVALAVATVALGVWADQQYKAAQYTADLTGSLDKQTGAISDSTREIVRNDLAARDGWWIFKKDSSFDAAEQLGLDLEDVTNAALGNEDALARVNVQLDEWRDKVQNDPATRQRDDWVELQLAIDRVNEAVQGNNESLTEAERLALQKAEADAELAEGEQATSEAMDVMTASAEAQSEALGELDAALQAIFDQAFSVEQAQDALIEKANALTGTVRGNAEALKAAKDAGDGQAAAAQGAATALDDNSLSALANRAALRDLAEGHADVIRKMADTGASSSELRAKALTLKEEFYRQAEAAGFTRDQVDRYATTLDQVPATVSTLVAAQTAAAESALDRVLSKVQRLDGRQVVTTITTRNVETGRINVSQTRAQAGGGILIGQAFAEGGFNGTVPRVPQVRVGGGAVVWNEPETGWEAYISGKPGMRDRNVKVWEDAGDRLGINFQRFADGGLTGTGRTAPAPLSLDGLAIEGTLELAGDGLTGYVKGVVRDAQSAQLRQVRSGRR